MKIKIKKVLSNLDIIIASFMLVILIFLTFLGVLSRRVFNSPFTWLEEIQLACMVWIVFAAAGAAFRTGNHVSIEIIYDILSCKGKKYLNYLISILVIVILGFLLINSILYIKLFLWSGRSTSILKIPYWLIYGIAPISFILMIISYFYSIKFEVNSEIKEAINE
ncbi:MAG: TRAP transporter small permease [Helcococcus sp.]|nr:TRAP transporter small permease [Helcococcus sp.]